MLVSPMQISGNQSEKKESETKENDDQSRLLKKKKTV